MRVFHISIALIAALGFRAIAKDTLRAANNSCTAPFNSCTMAGAQSIDAGLLPLAADSQYTFQAWFSSVVLPYSQSAFKFHYTYRSSKGKSAAS